MARILVRSGKSPLEALGPEETLGELPHGTFASNVGNYLFTDAVQRLLSVEGHEIVSDGYTTEKPAGNRHIARINEEFDHLALPLANAFRVSFTPSLRRLTQVIEKLTIPVSVIGVGAHLPLDGPTPLPADAVEVYTDFCRAVLERSPSIGVRGEFTRDFVLGLGFDEDQVEVIGCPSIYLHGPGHRVREPHGELSREDPIGLNLTLTSAGVLKTAYPEFFARVTEEFRNATYVAQVGDELGLLLWGDTAGTRIDPRLPDSLQHRLYREDRVRFFVDTKPWTEFLGTQRFVLGTRIHGSIAGILGGTPVMLANHDPRTRELAEYHEIPHRATASFGPDTRVEDLYAETDYTAFNSGMEKRYGVLTAFFDRHGLPHPAQPGADTSAFDAAWDATERPGAVVGPFAPEPQFREALVSRLAWLRQGVDVDLGRKTPPRTRPFVPGDPSLPAAGMAREVAVLRRELDRVTARLQRADQHQAELLARISRLEERGWRRQARRVRGLAGRARRRLRGSAGE